MKPPCMIMVAHMLPALRVAIAQQLIEGYRMKPIEAAHRMDVTPAAVTQYVKGTRGREQILETLKNGCVKDKISDLASKLVEDTVNVNNVLDSVCDICKTMRREGLLCELCKKSSSTKLQVCDFCTR